MSLVLAPVLGCPLCCLVSGQTPPGRLALWSSILPPCSLQMREKKSSSGMVGAGMGGPAAHAAPADLTGSACSTPGKLLLWSSILVPCIFISCSKKLSSGRLSLSVVATLSLCSISGCFDLFRPGRTFQGARCSLRRQD